MRGSKKILVPLGVVAAVSLAACGGGGGGGASAGGTTPTGTMNVQVVDAPTTDFDHVWVTITKIRLHTSNDAPASDPNWVDFPLAAPVSVDLTTLTNGTMAAVFNGLAVPAGTYQQIRLVLVGDGDPLANSAVAAGLTYNDQVDWTDGSGSHIAPLEIPAPHQGIGLNGTFTVAAGATLNLAIDFDIGHDVVRFVHGGNNAYTLKPNLQYYDLAEVGAINGRVDTTNLCTSSAAAAPTTCAYNLVIKSEIVSADGTHHAATRFTGIRADGSFTLFPVRVPTGQSSTSVDVLVRGRNMDTLLVRGVPVTAGTTPATNPTVLSSAALPLTLDGEYTANASAAISPTGSWVNFYQTLTGTGQAEIPYEVRYRHVNPFTGLLTDNIPLSSGPVQLAAYNAGGSLSFVPNTPAQGNGGFLVFAGAPAYARTEASSDPLLPPSGASPALFTMPALAVNPAIATADSISGSIAQATAGKYDSGFVVVARMGTIVQTQDISSVLAANAGTGGAYTVANLPGGSASQALPGAYYYLYGLVWNSADPILSLRRIDFSGYADLRTGSATGMNVTLN